MSCHRNQRSIDLHHSQVNSARERHRVEWEGRRVRFEAMRASIRAEVFLDKLIITGFAFIFSFGIAGIAVANLWYQVCT